MWKLITLRLVDSIVETDKFMINQEWRDVSYD